MASNRESTVVAVFNDASEARAAVADLRSAGFDSENIFVSSEGSGNPSAQGADAGNSSHHESGIAGWFKSLFGAEDHAHRTGYENAVAGGQTIVSVDASEAEFDQASEILESHSPIDIHTDDYATGGAATRGAATAGMESSRTGLTETQRERNTFSDRPVSTGGSQASAAGQAQSIPVVEEELQVGKRTVQRGGVRVYSRVAERPVEEQVRLREEHVHVDREPVNRPATDADLRAGRDQVIEVAEFAEEPVVAKQARVVEEVRVSKDATERVENISDSVRQTEVKVEDLSNGGQGPASVPYDDADFRNHFAGSSPGGSASYNDYAPAYRYGYDAARNPSYAGLTYSDAESKLRADYGSRYPNSTWESMKDSIRYGWDKVRGKTNTATTAR